MPKITFIGAGSFGFTRTLVRDLLTFPLLEGSQITLMDIHADRLEWSRRAVQRIVDEGHYPATVVTTLDRVEALRGADYVIVTILAGATEVWRHDIEIPARYGVDMNVGDTRSVSGIFRALRTIPVMVDIARDMERLCPRALLINYTNPMAMLCRAIDRTTSIAVTGLCHSVQGTAEMLARWIGAPMNEISYTCAGINHMAWYLRYEWNGQDAYPLIRNEMFLAFDHYVTESSGHNSEYSWWFRKRPDLIERYCTHGTGWNPGEHAYILKHYQEREQTWQGEIQKWLDNPEALNLKRGHEYAAYIINALEGGEPFTFNGNMPNHNLVDNLPQNACVEIPVWASRKGLEAVAVGALPPQCAMLTHLSAQIEEMAVEAALTGNRRLVYQAVANDPLSAAVLSLAEIQQMVDELFAVNQPHLPQF
jgi:alpha-galactosidase